MKRIIQCLVLGTLISTAQASPFPGNGDPVVLPAAWTYADRHAGEADRMVGSAIPLPGDGELIPLPVRSTYGQARASGADTIVGSAIPFPGDGELIPLPARSTYSDRFAAERVQAALGE